MLCCHLTLERWTAGRVVAVSTEEVAHGHGTECRRESTWLRVCLLDPTGVVLHDTNGRVDDIVQRGMPLQARVASDVASRP